MQFKSIETADIYLGNDAQGLGSHKELYRAFTQDSSSSLCIGEDLAQLIAKPSFQAQVKNELGSNLDAVQIKVTHDHQVSVAKVGKANFIPISFPDQEPTQEVLSIAAKANEVFQKLHTAEETHDTPAETPINDIPTPLAKRRVVELAQTTELKTLREELFGLRKALQLNHEKIHELEDKLKSSNSGKQELITCLTNALAENEDLEDTLHEAEETNKKLMFALKEEVGKKDATYKDFLDVRDKLQKANKEKRLQSLQTQLDKQAHHLKAAQEELSQSKAAANTQQRETLDALKESQSNNGSLRTCVQDLEKVLKDQNMEMVSLRKQLEKAKKTIQLLKVQTKITPGLNRHGAAASIQQQREALQALRESQENNASLRASVRDLTLALQRQTGANARRPKPHAPQRRGQATLENMQRAAHTAKEQAKAAQELRSQAQELKTTISQLRHPKITEVSQAIRSLSHPASSQPLNLHNLIKDKKLLQFMKRYLKEIDPQKGSPLRKPPRFKSIRIAQPTQLTSLDLYTSFIPIVEALSKAIQASENGSSEEKLKAIFSAVAAEANKPRRSRFKDIGMCLWELAYTLNNLEDRFYQGRGKSKRFVKTLEHNGKAIDLTEAEAIRASVTELHENLYTMMHNLFLPQKQATRSAV